MGKPKRSLKAALDSHQVKMLKNKQSKALESRKVAVLKKAGARPKPRPVIPYSTSDSILLVGEGDFSFVHSLVSVHGISPANITATTYDSEPICYQKYPWSQCTVQELKLRGMTIMFNVDARKLGNTKDLKSRRFSKVAFNFPHTGKGIVDQDRNILSNQELLVGFFKSVPSVLVTGRPNTIKAKKSKAIHEEDSDIDDFEPGNTEREAPERATEGFRGTVLVTLRDAVPYTLWKMPELAKKPSPGNPRYKQLRSFAFIPEQYPGYTHRRTAGHRGDREIPILEKDGLVNARTWEFELVSDL